MKTVAPSSSRGRPIRAGDLPLAVCFGVHDTVLRRLNEDDGERLLQFFYTHTADTIQQRYGYAFRRMSAERAAELVRVDQTENHALGVFEREEGMLRLIAVGRSCLEPDGESAEVAFVVREDRRRLGIATALLDVLRSIAREQGLHRLTAQVEANNSPMIRVFQRAGASFSKFDGIGALHVTLPLNRDSGMRGRKAPPRPGPRPCEFPAQYLRA